MVTNGLSDASRVAPAFPNDPFSLVSVIIPIHNAEPYLELALLTVENQLHANLEIICLNDGSTDDSLATIERHAAADDRYVVIDKPNEGYGATCNRGIAAAHGAWIAIVEPDDWIDLAMYRDMLAFASTFEAPIDIIKTPYWRVVDPDTPRERRYPCSYRGLVDPPRQPFDLNDAPHLIAHHPSIWSALYRRDFLIDNAIRFPELLGSNWADTPFLVDTLARARAIAYLDRPYYHYREETAAEAADFIANHPLVPIERWLAMERTLEAHPKNTAVNAAHTATAFTYLRRIARSHELTEPAIAEGIAAMFSSMDDDLVLSLDELSPEDRALYARVRGLPTPPSNALAHGRALARTAARTLRTSGLSAVLERFRSYRDARGGRA